MRHIFVFFINLANKHAQTNTNNYSKYHKISQNCTPKKNILFLDFFGSNSHIGQKSRAYSCPSLPGDTKGFRAKIKRAIFAHPSTPCEAFFFFWKRFDRTFASKVSYISWAKQESGQCSSGNFGSWDYRWTALLLLLHAITTAYRSPCYNVLKRKQEARLKYNLFLLPCFLVCLHFFRCFSSFDTCTWVCTVTSCCNLLFPGAGEFYCFLLGIPIVTLCFIVLWLDLEMYASVLWAGSQLQYLKIIDWNVCLCYLGGLPTSMLEI